MHKLHRNKVLESSDKKGSINEGIAPMLLIPTSYYELGPVLLTNSLSFLKFNLFVTISTYQHYGKVVGSCFEITEVSDLMVGLFHHFATLSQQYLLHQVTWLRLCAESRIQQKEQIPPLP